MKQVAADKDCERILTIDNIKKCRFMKIYRDDKES